MQKLGHTAEALKRWNKNHFGNSFECTKSLEKELLQLQSGSDLDRGKYFLWRQS